MPRHTSNQCLVSKSTDKSYIPGGQGQAVANVNTDKQSAEHSRAEGVLKAGHLFNGLKRDLEIQGCCDFAFLNSLSLGLLQAPGLPAAAGGREQDAGQVELSSSRMIQSDTVSHSFLGGQEEGSFQCEGQTSREILVIT